MHQNSIKPLLSAEELVAHLKSKGVVFDVVEDTDVTLSDLAQAFPAKVVDALRLLTHQPGVPYLDYVRSLATSPDANTINRA